MANTLLLKQKTAKLYDDTFDTALRRSTQSRRPLRHLCAIIVVTGLIAAPSKE